MNQVEVKRRQIQMISYMLGMISIWILGRKIGNNGIAYLAAALEGFYVLWCVTGAYISDSLGRMLRSKNAKGQYKNAAKMRRNIMIQQGVWGLAVSVLFVCLVSFFAEKLFLMPYSKSVMYFFAPVIFIRTISAVLLGYFQGNGSELPTALTAVLRQVLYLAFGLLFSSILGEYGGKVSALLGKPAFASMYGAMGVGLAILLTESVLTIMLILFVKGSKDPKSQKETDGMKTTDSFSGHILLLLKGVSGKVLLGLLESLPLWLGMILFQRNVADIYTSADSYGIYFGKYLILCGLLFLFSAVSVIAINAKTASYIRKDELRYAKMVFQTGLRIVLVYSLFFAVFVAVMAKQLAGILDDSGGVLLSEMLSYGTVLIVFVSLAFYFSRQLLLLGKAVFVYGCAAIGDVVFIISAVILGNAGKHESLTLVYAGAIAVGVYALLTGILVCRQLRMGIDVLRTLAIPAGSACLMGLLCLLLNKTFTPHLGNMVTLLVCFVLGSMVYLVLVLLLRCFSEQEMEAVPGCRVIRALGQLLRVF